MDAIHYVILQNFTLSYNANYVDDVVNNMPQNQTIWEEVGKHQAKLPENTLEQYKVNVDPNGGVDQSSQEIKEDRIKEDDAETK